MCGIVELCYRPLWSLIVTGVFMVVFLALTAWMWQHRSRQSRHVIIRVCVCLGQLSKLVSFARNEIVAGVFESATHALSFIALFGWASNAATIAFMTTRLANEAPQWLPPYTVAMQIFVGFAYPLLALIGGVNDAATCIAVSMISQLVMIVMMWAVGLPVFVSHFKIRKVVNEHRKSMRSTGATEEDVQRDNRLKKPMRTLLYQSVFITLLVVSSTVMSTISFRRTAKQVVRDTFYTECDGREATRVAFYQLWQVLLLWHSNVKDGRRKLQVVATKQLTSTVTQIKKKTEEGRLCEPVTNATRPSACRSQQSSPQDDDGATDTAHSV